MQIGLAAVAFLMVTLYWPGIDNAMSSPRWALLAAGMWPFLQPTTFTAGHVCFAAFVAWSAITFLWTPFPWDWVENLAELWMMGMAFWAGSVCRDLRPVFIAASLGLGINSALAIFQQFWPQFYGDCCAFIAQSVIPGGLFINQNLMAEAAAMVLAALVAERMWWYLPLAVPALILTVARGPIIALAAACALAAPRWVLLPGGALVGWVAWWRHGLWSDMRAEYYDSIINGLTWFGHGAGSFFGAFPTYSRPFLLEMERPINAHNDFLQVAFDLGLPGAALFACLVALVCRGGGGSRGSQAALAAFLVSGLVGFPMHMPTTAFLAALVAGHLCRGWAPVRLPAALRRVVVQGGAATSRHRDGVPGRAGGAVQLQASVPTRGDVM